MPECIRDRDELDWDRGLIYGSGFDAAEGTGEGLGVLLTDDVDEARAGEGRGGEEEEADCELHV